MSEEYAALVQALRNLADLQVQYHKATRNHARRETLKISLRDARNVANTCADLLSRAHAQHSIVPAAETGLLSQYIRVQDAFRAAWRDKTESGFERLRKEEKDLAALLKNA